MSFFVVCRELLTTNAIIRCLFHDTIDFEKIEATSVKPSPASDEILPDEYKAFYNEQVWPLEVQFEQKRLHAIETSKARIPFLAMVTNSLIMLSPLFIALDLSFSGMGVWDSLFSAEQYFLVYLFAVLVTPIFVASWANAPLRGFAKEIKSEIIPKILGYFGSDFQYHLNSPIPLRALKPSGVIPTHDFSRTEDFIQGSFKGIPLILFETQLIGTWQTNTFRKGLHVLVTQFKIPKQFKGRTVIRSRALRPRITKDLLLAGLSVVNLEDQNFSKKFEVLGSDQIESRYLLTPSFMERLLKVSELANAYGLEASFYDNNLLILIPTSHNHFELHACLFEPINLKRAMNVIVSDAQIIFGIIDELNLHDRTGL